MKLLGWSVGGVLVESLTNTPHLANPLCIGIPRDLGGVLRSFAIFPLFFNASSPK